MDGGDGCPKSVNVHWTLYLKVKVENFMQNVFYHNFKNIILFFFFLMNQNIHIQPIKHGPFK